MPITISIARARVRLTLAAVLAVAAALIWGARTPVRAGQTAPTFRSDVDLVSVTATVVDEDGYFVPGLRQDDFRLYEDDRLQPITYFSADPVPVSLGIALDASASMDGGKWRSALEALDQFFDLLDPEDEVFLYTFGETARLVHGWTTDRRQMGRALAGVEPTGATALFDATAAAVGLAQTGRHQKRAVVVISDGNDTNSRTSLAALHQQIRESDVLVYAIGIDGQAPPGRSAPPNWPDPGGRRRRGPFPGPFPPPRTGGGGGVWLPIPDSGPRPDPGRVPLGSPQTQRRPFLPQSGRDEGIDLLTLRDITDDSGGRTELVRTASDLGPATAGIVDELSRQYQLGYMAPTPNDGRWHVIRVETSDRRARVRARRGYQAGS